ncbi:MAG TPA: NAD(+) diphosphatase, partial [Spirochaetota bacterium]|nr:NAD(+) diphosphatase [Spirochaetota bacterium]
PSDNDYIFHYQNDSVLLLKQDDGYTLPSRRDLESHLREGELFLFSLDSVRCFMAHDIIDIDPNRFEYKEISYSRSWTRKELAWICAVGHDLKQWIDNNRFCGKCGSPTLLKSDERAVKCPSCGHLVFPKISPAIITAITHKGKILLAHNANFPTGRFSLIAGYADIGEPLEDCVKREAREEVGVEVTNIRYYKSQPWPYSGSMMIGFFAEAVSNGDVDPKIRVDGKEIAEAHWFTPENLPDFPPNRSIAGEMIELFVKEHSGGK